MTEQEVYDALHAYYAERNAELVGERRFSFLVVAVGEDDETITVGSTVIDPDIPEEIDGPPLEQTRAQQIALFLREIVRERAKDAKNTSWAITNACEVLGLERVRQIAMISDSGDQFADRLIREVERHGTG